MIKAKVRNVYRKPIEGGLPTDNDIKASAIFRPSPHNLPEQQ